MQQELCIPRETLLSAIRSLPYDAYTKVILAKDIPENNNKGASKNNRDASNWGAASSEEIEAYKSIVKEIVNAFSTDIKAIKDAISKDALKGDFEGNCIKLNLDRFVPLDYKFVNDFVPKVLNDIKAQIKAKFEALDKQNNNKSNPSNRKTELKNILQLPLFDFGNTKIEGEAEETTSIKLEELENRIIKEVDKTINNGNIISAAMSNNFIDNIKAKIESNDLIIKNQQNTIIETVANIVKNKLIEYTKVDKLDGSYLNKLFDNIQNSIFNDLDFVKKRLGYDTEVRKNMYKMPRAKNGDNESSEEPSTNMNSSSTQEAGEKQSVEPKPTNADDTVTTNEVERLLKKIPKFTEKDIQLKVFTGSYQGIITLAKKIHATKDLTDADLRTYFAEHYITKDLISSFILDICNTAVKKNPPESGKDQNDRYEQAWNANHEYEPKIYDRNNIDPGSQKPYYANDNEVIEMVDRISATRIKGIIDDEYKKAYTDPTFGTMLEKATQFLEDDAVAKGEKGEGPVQSRSNKNKSFLALKLLKSLIVINSILSVIDNDYVQNKNYENDTTLMNRMINPNDNTITYAVALGFTTDDRAILEAKLEDKNYIDEINNIIDHRKNFLQHFIEDMANVVNKECKKIPLNLLSRALQSLTEDLANYERIVKSVEDTEWSAFDQTLVSNGIDDKFLNFMYTYFSSRLTGKSKRNPLTWFADRISGTPTGRLLYSWGKNIVKSVWYFLLHGGYDTACRGWEIVKGYPADYISSKYLSNDEMKLLYFNFKGKADAVKAFMHLTSLINPKISKNNIGNESISNNTTMQNVARNKKILYQEMEKHFIARSGVPADRLEKLKQFYLLLEQESGENVFYDMGITKENGETKNFASREEKEREINRAIKEYHRRVKAGESPERQQEARDRIIELRQNENLRSTFFGEDDAGEYLQKLLGDQYTQIAGDIDKFKRYCITGEGAAKNVAKISRLIIGEQNLNNYSEANKELLGYLTDLIKLFGQPQIIQSMAKLTKTFITKFRFANMSAGRLLMYLKSLNRIRNLIGEGYEPYRVFTIVRSDNEKHGFLSSEWNKDIPTSYLVIVAQLYSVGEAKFKDDLSKIEMLNKIAVSNMAKNLAGGVPGDMQTVRDALNNGYGASANAANIMQQTQPQTTATPQPASAPTGA